MGVVLTDSVRDIVISFLQASIQRRFVQDEVPQGIDVGRSATNSSAAMTKQVPNLEVILIPNPSFDPAIIPGATEKGLTKSAISPQGLHCGNALVRLGLTRVGQVQR